MLFGLTKRVLTETRPKVVAKFVYNFGVKGIRSVELYKRRLRDPYWEGKERAI